MGANDMKAYYQDKWVTIYNGDCREILPELAEKSMDLVLTDPPYGINMNKGYKKNTDRILGDDGFTVMVFLDDILTEYRRVLNEHSAVYIFTRFDVMPYWWFKCKNYFLLKNCITWDKGGGFTGDLEGNYGNDSEMILYMAQGKHKLRGKREGNIWQYPKCKLEYHETQKPESLISHIIEKSSDVDMAVLDPFLGSGTTCYCAKKLNRKSIGIEIEERYCEIAANRCRQSVMEPMI